MAGFVCPLDRDKEPRCFHQMVVQVLPWRSFVDVVSIYNQLS